MNSVTGFLFSNLVLPAIAVQAKETDIEEHHRGAAQTTAALPVDKLGLGSSGVGHDAAPAFAARRTQSSARQFSRVSDDALLQELLAFRQWQSQQAGQGGGGGFLLSPRSAAGYSSHSPANASPDGLRRRHSGTAPPNIIIVNAGDNSNMHPSNLRSTQEPGQPPESGIQVIDSTTQATTTHTPDATHTDGSLTPLTPINEEDRREPDDSKQFKDNPITIRLPDSSPLDTEYHSPTSPKPALSTTTTTTTTTSPVTYTPDELYVAATQFYHRLVAEALGTWAVTFFIAGLNIEASLGHINQIGVAIGAGLVFVTLIYSLGQVSGAHFNPVVTFAFVLRGMFPFTWLPFYWVVQFVGALIAAAMLLGFYGTTIGDAGATLVPDAYSQQAGFFMETVLVFVLVFTILSMASRSKIVGPHAALAIGAVIAFNVMLAGSYSGASMNPWRSVCVSIVFPVSFYSIWVYFAGPFLGSTLAVLVVFLLAGKPRNDELTAGIGATIAVAVGNAISRDEEAEDPPVK